MPSKRQGWSAVLTILVGLASCSDMRALSTLMQAIQAEFRMTPDLNLNNGEDLAITFARVSVDALKLDSAGQDAFARRVATFAKHHYPRASVLRHITVTTTGAGATLAPMPTGHTFDIKDLP